MRVHIDITRQQNYFHHIDNVKSDLKESEPNFIRIYCTNLDQTDCEYCGKYRIVVFPNDKKDYKHYHQKDVYTYDELIET